MQVPGMSAECYYYQQCVCDSGCANFVKCMDLGPLHEEEVTQRFTAKSSVLVCVICGGDHPFDFSADSIERCLKKRDDDYHNDRLRSYVNDHLRQITVIPR